ncbi:uncharacterized protein LOC133849202 [Drosophila sulfurigaster albostrigata]|uniref:uncharacterized protein LOC133849202 n=1 Tax=Drosophila sulfurigaster albostrigata TaxID=89887 RepID=UPI002D218FB1|nr:uncharacterized protein LOC133849202 [Drosophila sulfurigaster albostrigata]
MEAEAAANDLGAENKPIKLRTAVLSDVDDISDIDIEEAAEELHKTMTAKPVYNRRRSIFNTTLDLNESRCLPASQALDQSLASFKAYAEKEKATWETFSTNNIKNTGHSKGSPQSSSSCYKPSAEHQAYLSKAPNLHAFIRGHGSFMDDSIRFLMEFEEMQDVQESLKQSCVYQVQESKRHNISECFARNRDRNSH